MSQHQKIITVLHLAHPFDKKIDFGPESYRIHFPQIAGVPDQRLKSLILMDFNGFPIKIKKIHGFGLSPRLGRLQMLPNFFILLNKAPQDSSRAGSELSIPQILGQKL